MKLLLQRVRHARVLVNEMVQGKMDTGLLVYVCFSEGDTLDALSKWAIKCCSLRVFPDQAGKMNMSVVQIKGSILTIPNFTLSAACDKGNRPYYGGALHPEKAEPLFNHWVRELTKYISVHQGVFGADMKIESIADGPVNIMLEWQ